MLVCGLTNFLLFVVYFQSAIDNQMRLVKSGCDLSSLERVPAPVVPIPPHLGMMMMRTGFFPMMSVPRAPFGVGGMGPMPGMGPMLGPGPGGMVDPSSMMMNKPPRAPGMMGGIPVSMVSCCLLLLLLHYTNYIYCEYKPMDLLMFFMNYS